MSRRRKVETNDLANNSEFADLAALADYCNSPAKLGDRRPRQEDLFGFVRRVSQPASSTSHPLAVELMRKLINDGDSQLIQDSFRGALKSDSLRSEDLAKVLSITRLMARMANFLFFRQEEEKSGAVMGFIDWMAKEIEGEHPIEAIKIRWLLMADIGRPREVTREPADWGTAHKRGEALQASMVEAITEAVWPLRRQMPSVAAHLLDDTTQHMDYDKQTEQRGVIRELVEAAVQEGQMQRLEAVELLQRDGHDIRPDMDPGYLEQSMATRLTVLKFIKEYAETYVPPNEMPDIDHHADSVLQMQHPAQLMITEIRRAHHRDPLFRGMVEDAAGFILDKPLPNPNKNLWIASELAEGLPKASPLRQDVMNFLLDQANDVLAHDEPPNIVLSCLTRFLTDQCSTDETERFAEGLLRLLEKVTPSRQVDDGLTRILDKLPPDSCAGQGLFDFSVRCVEECDTLTSDERQRRMAQKEKIAEERGWPHVLPPIALGFCRPQELVS